jgi:UDP-glucose 4-epimerase
MPPVGDEGVVMVTGAGGHIGREVCRQLKTTQIKFLPVDLRSGNTPDIVPCDLTVTTDLSRLFESHPVRAVVHLAAILPSAFHRDPLTAADVNVAGSVELLRQSVKMRVKRFVLASSMSVYGSASTGRALTEDDPAAPDEPYGASKRAVELVGETLAKAKAIEFVSLRIAGLLARGSSKPPPRGAPIFSSHRPVRSRSTYPSLPKPCSRSFIWKTWPACFSP